MARIRLDIADMAHRITIQTMMTAEGHRIDEATFDVRITDSSPSAVQYAAEGPVIVLASATEIPAAAAALRKGVFAYVFVPLQPGELALQVERASRTGSLAPPAGESGTLEEIESRAILAAMRRCNHNQARAARELGIGRNTLWRKLRKINGR